MRYSSSLVVDLGADEVKQAIINYMNDMHEVIIAKESTVSLNTAGKATITYSESRED